MERTSKQQPKYMSTEEVAKMLGVSINTVRRYVNEYGLPVLKFPGLRKWVFREDLVEEWFLKHSQPEVYVNNQPVKEGEYRKLRVLMP